MGVWYLYMVDVAIWIGAWGQWGCQISGSDMVVREKLGKGGEWMFLHGQNDGRRRTIGEG